MIFTFGRSEIENGIDIAEPYVLISISTPVKMVHPHAHLFDEDHAGAMLPPDEFRLEVLRLRFDDYDDWPIGLTDRQRAHVALYSPEQAAQVAAFVKGWQVNFVIHCDAGISRSQGMANAIHDHLDVPVKHFRPGMPNRLVYGLTWKALRPGDAMGRLREQKTPPWLRDDAPESQFPTVQPRLPVKRGGSDRYRIRFHGDPTEPMPD